MKPTLPPLKIATPCPKNWADLRGDSKRRFCDHCQLHVHNLSAMSEGERDAFVSSSGGRCCVAYVQRPDGSMVTPSRWDSLRRLFSPVRWAYASLLATILPLGFLGCANRQLLGKVAPACNSHQQKTAHKADDGQIMMGTPVPPKSTEQTSR